MEAPGEAPMSELVAANPVDPDLWHTINFEAQAGSTSLATSTLNGAWENSNVSAFCAAHAALPDHPAHRAVRLLRAGVGVLPAARCHDENLAWRCWNRNFCV